MKKKALTAAIAALFVSSLTGCALFSPPEPSPALQFSYATTNGPAAGLVRAFILNGSTILQFIDITQAQPKVYSGDQPTPLPYQVVGQYAILSGVHPALRVVANGATANVAAAGFSGTQAATAPTPPASLAGAPLAVQPAAKTDPLAAQLQDALRQLEQARKELADLKRDMAAGGASAGNIKPAALIVPAGDPGNRTWTLTGNRTLKDNLADFARQAGYAEPNWKASNPYMVTYTVKYSGTFLDVIGKIAEQVPALDFRVYSWKKTIEVADSAN